MMDLCSHPAVLIGNFNIYSAFNQYMGGEHKITFWGFQQHSVYSSNMPVLMGKLGFFLMWILDIMS